MAAIARQSRAMLGFAAGGSIVFDYGNNIRGQAERAGVEGIGKGPLRWIALSENPADIYRLDQALLERWPEYRWLSPERARGC